MTVPTAKIMLFFSTSPCNVFIYKQTSLADVWINAYIAKHVYLEIFDTPRSFITNIAV